MYQSYLEEFVRKLISINRPPKARLVPTQIGTIESKLCLKAGRRDRKALLSASKLLDGRYQYHHKMSFVMREARIESLLRDMDDFVFTIKGFIEDTEDLHQILRSH